MALPLIAEAALNSCFQNLFRELHPILCSTEILKFWNIGSELDMLLKKVTRVQDLLNVAEERSQERSVGNWMVDLRELAYDMEDVVDEMNIERMRIEKQAAERNHAYKDHHPITNTFTLWDNLTEYTTEKLVIKRKLNDVLRRLDEVLKEATELGLKSHTIVSSSMLSGPIRDYSVPSVDEYEVYGRNADREHIIESLMTSTDSSKKNYDVITIVGLGGIGKTTLAQLVFDDHRVNDYFDYKSWACVSDLFDLNRVMKELVECATGGNFSNMSTTALLRCLQDIIRDRKIFFVLDDVWKVKAWDMIKISFAHCAKGSKILATTRDQNIGNAISNMDVYELEALEDEHCWVLFKEKAFGKLVDGNLEKIGRKIVKKCKGVPLAVKIMGSFLRFASEERWESALRNELWLSTDGDCDEIFLILKLSYNHLPSNLKRCFEYLSLFPTDYKFGKDRLVRMWIAEGLIESKEERLLEDIGNDYYDELQRRCLIQKDGKMHDLVHSLACIISRKFYCSLPNDTRSHVHMRRIRHLSLISKDVDLKVLDETKCLRTIMRLGPCSLDEKWLDKIPKWSLLRVLCMGGSDILNLPSLIGNLKHLRYLDISFSRIQNLPSSVCELHNLQALNLYFCLNLNSLPNEMGNLQMLQYLRLSETPVSVLPRSIVKLSSLIRLDLNYCQSLASVPEDIGDLQSLRSLHLKHTKISVLPESVCKLYHLQILDLDNCYELLHLPRNIGDLQNLQELHLKNTPINYLPDSICRLQKVQVLDLCLCQSLSSLPNEIGDLGNLRKLDLSCTSISQLPQSMCKLFNLHELNISGCKGHSQLMDGIGNLQNLKHLVFSNDERLPTGIGKLAHLEELNEYVVGKEEGRRIGELKDMNKLKGSLTISHIENVDTVEQALMANLGSKIYIEEINFRWGSILPEDTDGANADERNPSGDTVKVDDAEDNASDHSRDNYGSVIATNDNVKDCYSYFFFDNGGMGDDSAMREGELEAKVLDALEPYPTTLKALSFHNYSGKWFPKWMSMLRFLNLKKLRIEELHKITEVMNIELVSLESLVIKNCPRLRDVSMAIPNLKELKVFCRELRTVSIVPSFQNLSSPLSSMMNLPQLKLLWFWHCSRLRDISVMIPELEELQVRDCGELNMTLMDVLPSSLKSLKFALLPYLTSLHDMKISTSWVCSDLLSNLTLLEEIEFFECEQLQSLAMERPLPPALRELKVIKCGKLELLAEGDWLSQSHLKSLKINGCDQLRMLVTHGLLPPTLEDLTIINCQNLESFLEDDEVITTSLKKLKIKGCPKLKFIPERLCHLTSLIFDFSCLLEAGFDASLSILSSLRELHISGYSQHQLPQLGDRHNGLHTHLDSLWITDCPNLTCLPNALYSFTSLTMICIINCPQLISFPEEELPPMLRGLRISSCRNLQYLPKKLHGSTSLRWLSIEKCHNVESQSDDQLPPNLESLEVMFCLKLRQQVYGQGWKNWLKHLH